MFKNSQQQHQQQTLRLSPQQIQYLNLLQLSVGELEQRIEREIEDNPTLENGENVDNIAENAENTEGSAEGSDADKNDDAMSFDELADYYNLTDDQFDDYKTDIKKQDTSEQNTTISPEILGFRDNLRQQLALRPLTDLSRALAEYLIETVDDDGYLRRALDDIADDLAFSQSIYVEEADIQTALAVVQQLEPVGIGSRDLSEYLMLQLREVARNGTDVAAACAIVDGFLEDLANRQLEKIRRTLDLSEAEIQHATQLLSSLNPKPVAGLARADEANRRIIPDFIIATNENGALEATVLGNGFSEVRLNRRLVETLEALEKTPQPNAEQKSTAQYLRSKIGASSWLIDALRQRQHSLTATIQTILSLQAAYFKTGSVQQLRPMILKDVAERVELDISTISRITSSRYVQTDFGILPLKSLFTEGVMTDDGRIVSNRAVRELIAQLVAEEDKTAPMTDQQITDNLNKRGFSMARRTVAKYRETLNIPTAQRRVLG